MKAILQQFINSYSLNCFIIQNNFSLFNKLREHNPYQKDYKEMHFQIKNIL